MNNGETVSPIRVAFFGAHKFEIEAFQNAVATMGGARDRIDFKFLVFNLEESSVEAARGCDVVCSFVSDNVNASVISQLRKLGVKLLALRSAGYNHVDLGAAQKNEIPVVRVPAYSPYAVAEHAIALLLSLNRKIPRANQRVRELNFSLEGLVGFDLHDKTVGVIGTGRIGSVFVKIASGFGCRIKCFDLQPQTELTEKYGVEFVSLTELFKSSDVISLHLPLNPKTKHLINADAFAQMKRGVYLINTSRGGLVDTRALIAALKSGKVGGAGLDVYEEEEHIFFEDLSGEVLQDDVLARLMTFPNVLITSHQGFLTHEALHNIAHTTISNILEWADHKDLSNQVKS